MDEDAGVKAPVTRLRRRLSVEQTEESKSPAINTPTKKRGGRKTKPELEPVDENTPDNTTSRRATRKAIKDVIEPEEKPVTPSRRSTRIKSNTSIKSETALTVDSPRAKRAARRASTAGSDNEAPVTPARQTRRTRKDSTSSAEKEPQLPPKQGIQIREVIIEEPESDSSKSVPPLENINELSNSTNSTRRSPRLSEKSKKTTLIIEESHNVLPLSEPAKNILSPNNSNSVSLPLPETSDDSKRNEDNPAHVPDNKPQSAENRLSIASAKLIEELNTEVITKSNLNKSLSTVEGKQSVSKRKRTKSWTTLSASVDSQFYSDNEITKSKIKNNVKSPLVPINKGGSGDGSVNTSIDQDMSKKSILERKKKNSMNFTVEIINEPLDKFHENTEKESKDEISFSHNKIKIDMNTGEFLERKPSGDIKTMVFIDDSDSNSEKTNEPTKNGNEDQCVPVIEHPVKAYHADEKTFTSILDKNEQNIFNISKRKVSEQTEVEPMDIDETIPENLIIPETDTTKLNTTEKESTSTSTHISNLTIDEIVNKSGKKSSISNNLDKSGMETKSTLILSQIKDLSAGDISNAVKSPQVTNNKLPKSVDDLNITQENDIKQNVSIHYSTSTPLQDKNFLQKFKGIHVSTPIISSQDNQVTEELANVSKDNHNISKLDNDEHLKDTTTANTVKDNHGKPKKLSDKEKIHFQSEISQSEIKETKEKLVSDKETLDEMDIVKDAVSSEQRNESKLNDVSLNEESIKLSSKIKKSKRNSSSSEGSEMESFDDTGGEDHLLDDEAEDAGDDYESGDSQNESEKQYEKDHEVIDKGETLTTDDDFLDDSDYEKDSFIVSSNEEDEELLDGTDDDLSMSDNELKMTAKSKKKYNERKLKEQKQASREMFESRHKLNSSNKSSDSIMGKTKKNKRQQISSSESEEDVPTKSKKNIRMRLDSTKEASLHADESEHKISKKKNKVDTDSSSDDSVPNENEMTIYNESMKESDPLNLIKAELKSPQKSANSTIAFIDSEELNNDGIDKNELTKTQTEFDPLQATMFVDEDDSGSSDNENIIQHYDSVLQELNKSNSKLKTKAFDISLSLDNKRKKKEKNTIVDELNLTQVKSGKKTKKQKQNDYSVKDILPKKDNGNESSDSIELNLLFSEESNSDTSSEKKKMKSSKADSEDIIPLKITQAKTDLRENKGDKEEGANFFVDTVGAQANASKESHNISLKKNANPSAENINAMDKSVNKSVSKVQAEENSDDEAPLEVSYQKEKSSKRKSKTQDETVNAAETCVNESIAKTPTSDKKNKKKTKLNESLEHTDNAAETCIIESIAKTPPSAKKSKNKAKLNETSEQADITCNLSINKSLLEIPRSGNKEKNQSESSLEKQTDNLEAPNIDVTTSEKNKKRKKSSSTSFTENNETQSVPDNLEVLDDASTTEKKKKKHKKSASTSFKENHEIPCVPEEITVNDTTSKKRKRKSSPSTTKKGILSADVCTAMARNTSAEGSQKKKRKIVAQDDNIKAAEEAPTEEEKGKQSVKKQDKNTPASNVRNHTTGIDELDKKRNRKRKDRDEDEALNSTSKTLKENTFNKVTRLPASVLEKLDDAPTEVPRKKPNVISTTEFIVQETKKRRVKPSNYLEESIYLNELSNTRGNNKKHLEKPKVLPFVPTASTSSSGFTTNFQINVLPSEVMFVAQSNTVSNFRENHLYGNKIRRLGTYDMYKKQRNMKLSKF